MTRITESDIDQALGLGSANDGAHAVPGTNVHYFFTDEELRAHEEKIRQLERHRLVNTPETADFLQGVALEAIHQRERWGTDHDAGKTPFDWVFLIGHLATRAAMQFMAGNLDKALHHAITTAAACANWHAAMQGKCDMRPGIEGDVNETFRRVCEGPRA